MNDYSDRLRMIKYLYQIAIDPDAYENLVEEWAKVVHHSSIRTKHDTVYDDELVDHITRASEILERLDETIAKPIAIPLSQTIEIDPNPAMLISHDGKIIVSNEAARKTLDAQEGKALTDYFPASSEMVKKLRAQLDSLSNAAPKSKGIIGLLELNNNNHDQALLLAISHATCKAEPKVAGLVTNLAPMWSTNTSSIVKKHFDLTVSEIEVVQRLIEGQNVTQIAEARGTSIHTVRTQIKSILLKTNMETQLDLVRQIGFMQRYESTPQDNQSFLKPSTTCNSLSRHHILTLKSGKNFEYTLVGPSDGTPILYLHGIIDSTEFPANVLNELETRNLQFIAPSRPSFGNSDPVINAQETNTILADQIVELLDFLKIDRLPVVGHMAGFYYGVTLAHHYKSRVQSILGVSSVVPFLNKQHFSQMNSSHRLVALTANKSPGLLSLFIKGGIAVIRGGNEDTIINLAYKGNQADFNCAQNPEIKKILHHGFHFLSAQGHAAFQNDTTQICRDWSHLMQSVTCPIIQVHGIHDAIMRLNAVHEFADQYDNCQVVDAKKSGQLVFANEPGLVFDQLEELLRK